MPDLPAYNSDNDLPMYGADGMPMVGCCCAYRQAFECDGDAPLDVWYSASLATAGDVLKDDDADPPIPCAYWGEETSDTPGTVLTAEQFAAVDTFASCEACSNVCTACTITLSAPACSGTFPLTKINDNEFSYASGDDSIALSRAVGRSWCWEITVTRDCGEFGLVPDGTDTNDASVADCSALCPVTGGYFEPDGFGNPTGVTAVISCS